MNNNKFINRRKEPRLPYFDKVIVSNSGKHLTAHAVNISRGGIFITTMDAFPIDTNGYAVFMLPNYDRTLAIKTRIAHIVFDKQRSDVECGMGLEFLELRQTHSNLLNLHMLNDQKNYFELRDLLSQEKLDLLSINLLRSKLPGLSHYDLLGLKYRINRICTLFEQPVMSNSLTAA